MHKTICLIAQFPPPVHGLSKAVDMLYRSELAKKYGFEAVNITDHRKFFAYLLRIAQSRADLFYVTLSQSRGGNLRDLIILTLLHLQKKKCVVHLHGGGYRAMVEGLPALQRKANFAAAARLSGAIVLSPSLKAIFRGMLPDDRIFVVPNCVADADRMSEPDFLAKLHTPASVRHVLYLSHFIREKGYMDVLELARLEQCRVERGEAPRFHFHFAGEFFDPAERDGFFAFLRAHRLAARVTFHGMVQGDEKRRLLRQCHLFTLLTRYPKEGQPISMLEAMSNGMAVVTTDHAGIPDLVADGENGIVVTGKPDLPALLERMAVLPLSAIMQANRARILAAHREQQHLEGMDRVFAHILLNCIAPTGMKEPPAE